MEGGSWATALGIAAGLCSTASFVPQLLKAWRQNDTEAISKRMYLVTVTAFVLWTSYGFVIGSLPIVVFNLLSLILSGAILVLTLRHQRTREGSAGSSRSFAAPAGNP